MEIYVAQIEHGVEIRSFYSVSHWKQVNPEINKMLKWGKEKITVTEIYPGAKKTLDYQDLLYGFL